MASAAKDDSKTSDQSKHHLHAACLPMLTTDCTYHPQRRYLECTCHPKPCTLRHRNLLHTCGCSTLEHHMQSSHQLTSLIQDPCNSSARRPRRHKQVGPHNSSPMVAPQYRSHQCQKHIAQFHFSMLSLGNKSQHCHQNQSRNNCGHLHNLLLRSSHMT